MKEIRNFNHPVLGDLYVFGDETGLWFSYTDVRSE